MFLNRNKKNNDYPCKPQFYYIKVGFKGVKIYRHVYVMKRAYGQEKVLLQENQHGQQYGVIVKFNVLV